jgi:hypothetical protein
MAIDTLQQIGIPFSCELIDLENGPEDISGGVAGKDPARRSRSGRGSPRVGLVSVPGLASEPELAWVSELGSELGSASVLAWVSVLV